MTFLWLKALHIIFVVCWFAGIFYLPRLFVYHTLANDQATRDHLALMQYKLYRFVTPFALLSVALGILLLASNWHYYLSQLWMQIKIALVCLLIGYHISCGILVGQFQRGLNTRGHLFFRIYNELPVLILFAVVILVVVRPFSPAA